MVKHPRVLQLSSLALSRGGIETFLASLTRGLSAQYEIVVASAGNPDFLNRIHEAGGRTVRWMAKSALDVDAFRGFLALLEQERPVLVHIHDARAGWLGRVALVTKKIPVLMTAHLPSYYYRWDRLPRLRRGTYAIMEGMLNRLATTKVIYPSLSGYQYALKSGISPASKALCIPNGIDTRQFSINPAERNAFRTQMGVAPEQPVIGALGRLSVEKNFALIVEAFSQIQSKHTGAQVWIAGDGPERKNLEAQVQANGLSDRIRFLGENVDVSLTLAACDIFALASWYEGGRTLSVMEAQASGKPCVVSNVGDLPWMVEDGTHGFVFPEGDAGACARALESLLSNPARREAMGKAALTKAAQEYGLENMIQAYDDLYASLLQRRSLSR